MPTSVGTCCCVTQGVDCNSCIGNAAPASYTALVASMADCTDDDDGHGMVHASTTNGTYSSVNQQLVSCLYNQILTDFAINVVLGTPSTVEIRLSGILVFRGTIAGAQDCMGTRVFTNTLPCLGVTRPGTVTLVPN